MANKFYFYSLMNFFPANNFKIDSVDFLYAKIDIFDNWENLNVASFTIYHKEFDIKNDWFLLIMRKQQQSDDILYLNYSLDKDNE